jgi:hypothetical protein
VAGCVLLDSYASLIRSGFDGDASDYVDRAFSAAVFFINPDKKLSLIQSTQYLKFKYPSILETVKNVDSEWNGEETAQNRSFSKRLVSEIFPDDPPNPLLSTMAIISRFVVGHEIGHYVRKENPKLRLIIESQFESLIKIDRNNGNRSDRSDYPINKDVELFCDVVGAVHVVRITSMYTMNIKSVLYVLMFLFSILDLMWIYKKGIGNRPPNLLPRMEFIHALAGELSNKGNLVATELLMANGDLDTLLIPFASVFADLLQKLAEIIQVSEPNWYLPSAHFLTPTSFSQSEE